MSLFLAALVAANARTPRDSHQDDQLAVVKSQFVPFWTHHEIPTIECELPPSLSRQILTRLHFTSTAWVNSPTMTLPARVPSYGTTGKIYAPRPATETLLAFDSGGQTFSFQIEGDTCTGTPVTLPEGAVQVLREGRPAAGIRVDTCLGEAPASNADGLVRIKLPPTGMCDVALQPPPPTPQRFHASHFILDAEGRIIGVSPVHRKDRPALPPRIPTNDLRLQTESNRIHVVGTLHAKELKERYNELSALFHETEDGSSVHP